eukprot:SAG31_NODE_18919_length_618_cov_0.861272_1_plen_34_part_10
MMAQRASAMAQQRTTNHGYEMGRNYKIYSSVPPH